MRLLVRLLCLACVLLSLPTQADPGMRFIYPPPEHPQDQRLHYYWTLLDAALQASSAAYGPYTLQSYATPLSSQRALAEVASGDAGRINILTRASNPELESQLRAIPIPLDRGLLGYRLFLIRPELQAKLDQVKTLEQLQAFSIGQGKTWVDAKILSQAGFKVVLGDQYNDLFPMLRAGRFDLFSRGVNEIQAEWLAQGHIPPGLQIEQRLLLHYPMPRYFFVPRTAEGERMARRIESGLRSLARSGAFQRHYLAYKRQVLAGLDLRGRRVFRIDNPLLKEGGPRHEAFWWDDLSSELAPAQRGKPKHPRSAP